MQEIVNKGFLILFIFTLIFGILLYDAIGFDYTDEFCALFLFMLFLYYVFHTKEWPFKKDFLITIGVFIFYLFYSFYINSNRPVAILTDFLIQIKPYLGFFCVYSMAPYFNKNRKEILKSISLIFWSLLLLIGLGDFVIYDLIWDTMGHPAYYAAAVIIVSMTYLLCSDFSKRDKLIFIIMLSIGILSGRSKFYGFFILSAFMIFFYSNFKNFKWSLRNILIIAGMLAAMVYVAQDKISLYFYEAATNELEREMIARYMFYAVFPDLLKDYFPFGSGFASYGTFASGLYYSPIYADYGMNNTWGITKSNYSFIGDTYYPSLAQFGIVGVMLFAFFWFYILRKAYNFSKRQTNSHYFCMIVMIIGYFAIESIADSTISTHRGFFVMMLLGYLFANIQREQTTTHNGEQIVLSHESSSNK